MVGLGARDDLAYAHEFVDTTGVTFPMLWDETGESWKRFEVPFQPAGVLVDTDGSWLARWQGVIDEQELLSYLGA